MHAYAHPYGAGLAELRLGEALFSSYPRDEYVIGTKVGRIILDEIESTTARDLGEKGGLFEHGLPSRVVYDYSEDDTLRSIEDSLKRLRTDRLDYVWIHDPAIDFHGDAWRDIFDTAMSHTSSSPKARNCKTMRAAFPSRGSPHVPLRALQLTDVRLPRAIPQCSTSAGMKSEDGMSGWATLIRSGRTNEGSCSRAYQIEITAAATSATPDVVSRRSIESQRSACLWLAVALDDLRKERYARLHRALATAAQRERRARNIEPRARGEPHRKSNDSSSTVQRPSMVICQPSRVRLQLTRSSSMRSACQRHMHASSRFARTAARNRASSSSCRCVLIAPPVDTRHYQPNFASTPT
ncbi:aldo/keto reductase [Paraburkholderia sp. JHI2823]|uniref:aldo/keto reductase n=1 Tax=Paraburkholderia sp. JHI2823 TaxID=3112960 RepID=UPI00316F50E2